MSKEQQFENLKVKINLESGFIADRFLTLEGILLFNYYAVLRAKGTKDEGSKTLNIGNSEVDFLERKGDTLSGSIWYVEKEAPFHYDFRTYYKKSEHRKIYDVTDAKKETDGRYKNYMITDEVIITPSVYFYVRGDRVMIEKLLGLVTHIGKKAAQGLGKVTSVSVEAVKEDKGFFLNATTPSKPLPCSLFDISSHKVALYRGSAPYWSNVDLVPCYMPTSSAYEKEDRTAKVKKFHSLRDFKYKPNFVFAHEAALKDKDGRFLSLSLGDVEGDGRKNRWTATSEGGICAIGGHYEAEGVKINHGTIGAAISVLIGKSFTDFNYILGKDFVSLSFLEGLRVENLRGYGNTLITSKGISNLYGASAEEGKKLKDYLANLVWLKAPYSINIKDTMNSQHVVFKNRISISNGIIAMQYGNSTQFIDGELLDEARNEYAAIQKTHPHLKKSHLLGNFSDNFFANIGNAHGEDSHKIVEDFHKKYSHSIRLAGWVSF